MREEDRAVALKTLQEAIEITVRKTKNKSILVERKDNVVRVGHYRVVKEDDFLNIYDRNILLYKDMLLVDTVIGLIERLLLNKLRTVPLLLQADNEYEKHFIDMKYHMRSFQHASKDKSDNRYIFYDRYLVSKDKANTIRAKVERLRFQL